MQRRPTTQSAPGVIEKFINSAFDDLKDIADNLELIFRMAELFRHSLVYLGLHEVAPTTRLDGSPIKNGDYYVHGSTNMLMFWDALDTEWVEISPDEFRQLRDEVVAARDVAVSAKDTAVASATVSTLKANEAGASADAAKLSEGNAKASEDASELSAVSASVSATKAGTEASKASASASAAKASEDAALNSKNTATIQAGIATTKASEASASANAAKVSENAAASSATSASASATQANTEKVAAEAAKIKAQAWADNPQNTAVETGKYSAKHHAINASASAATATTEASGATAAKDLAITAKVAAEAARDVANAAKVAAEAAKTSAQSSATSAGNSATVATTKATESSTSAANALNTKNEVIVLKQDVAAFKDTASLYAALSQQYANNSEDTPIVAGEYSALHWAKKAEKAARTVVRSGGVHTPTASKEYPTPFDADIDEQWFIGFPNGSDTYTFTTGDLAGVTVSNTDIIFYDDPIDEFIHIPSPSSAAILRINGKTGSSVDLGSGDIPHIDIDESPTTVAASLRENKHAVAAKLPITANAVSASKWVTPRTLTFTGDVSGTSPAIDGSGNVSITLTVGDDSHNHSIGTVAGLQAALDSKLGVSANAVTASKLQTARTISLTGDVTGSVSFDGSANASITAVVADDSHSHIWSNLTGVPVYATRWPTATEAGAYTKSEVDAKDNAKLNLAGGDLSGRLTLNTFNDAIVMNPGAGQASYLRGKIAGVDNWYLGRGSAASDDVMLHSNAYSRTLRITSDGIIIAGTDQAGKIYTTGNKPTAADVGAVNQAGDTMTGTLSVNKTGEIINAPALTGSVKQAIGVSGNGLYFGNSTLDTANLETKAGGTLNHREGSNSYRVYTTGYKPTASDVGAAPATHYHVEIFYQDTRSTDWNPLSSPNQFKVTFQNNGTNAVNDGGSWYSLMHVPRYHDASGGYGNQIAFTDNNGMFLRRGTGASSWTSWYRVYTAANPPSAAEVGAFPASGGQTSGAITSGGGLGVSNSSSSSGIGLSLYGGAKPGMPEYGMMFAGTSTFGSYGAVQGDWATYFTMSGANNRGWVFRHASSNVASISSTGDMHLAYNANVNDCYIRSDKRLKSNLTPIDSALDKVNTLTAYTYDKRASLDSKETSREVGIIAQDLKEVLPEAVSGTGEGDSLMTISNSGVNALLVEAIKELKAELDELKSQLKAK